MLLTLLLALLHGGVLVVLIANLCYLSRQPPPREDCPLPRLSVIIPARNEEEALPRLLRSLSEQDHPDFEVIVYDDASEDATWDILEKCGSGRLAALRGGGPPEGWIGKVHALYQATRRARGERYLFLDADTELLHPAALRMLAARFEALPAKSVLTALPRFRGGGLLLVSLIPSVVLLALPWPLVRRSSRASLGALSGACWMIRSETYHALEPHRHVRNEVLEDVRISRYLKRHGIAPVLQIAREEIAVRMYGTFGEAWRGLRKNAYLIAGGTPWRFLIHFVLYVLIFVAAPIVSIVFLLTLYGFKVTTDRVCRLPWHVSLLAPVSFALGAILEVDSAISHWQGRVEWKGRSVSS